MTPKAEIMYNHDYAQRLYRGAGTFTEAWQDLIYRGEVFEQVFDQAIQPILRALPEVTGYPWSEDHATLPIYLIVDGESFAAPLTLAVTTDVEASLFELVRLLVRTNLPTGFPSEQRREQTLHAVAAAVVERAGLDLTEAIAAADLDLRERFGADLLPLRWDLRSQPAKHYLNA